MIMLMPAKYQPDYIFLRHVPLRRVHLFTAIQTLCLAVLWVIKTIKSISIVFPLMVSLLICCLHSLVFQPGCQGNQEQLYCLPSYGGSPYFLSPVSSFKYQGLPN